MGADIVFDMWAEKSAHIGFQDLIRDFKLISMDIPMPNGGTRKSPVYVMNEEQKGGEIVFLSFNTSILIPCGFVHYCAKLDNQYLLWIVHYSLRYERLPVYRI